MLAFIMLFGHIQTQRAFKTGIKQSDVTDAGRTIMGMISDDLRQVADAQNEGVTNLYWSWAGSNQFAQGGDHDSGGNTIYYRTNQQDEIYILVHTNTTGWESVMPSPTAAPNPGWAHSIATWSSPTLPRLPTISLAFLQQYKLSEFRHQLAPGRRRRPSLETARF